MFDSTSFTGCDIQAGAVARDITVTFCAASLGLVRSVNGVSAVELADITSIADVRRNNVASFETSNASVEVFGLQADLPTPGMRGELVIAGDNIAFAEYLILESVSVQASVGEAIIYTCSFQTAVDMST